MKKYAALTTLLIALSSMCAASENAPTLQVQKNLTSMPLAFTENIGQWDDLVLFRADAGGATMWITKSGVYHQFTRRIEGSTEIAPGPMNYLMHDPMMREEQAQFETMMIKASFVGANLDPIVTGEGAMDYKCNYFIGNDPEQWHTDVPNYQSVLLEGVYTGINLRYYGNGKQTEYDFIVSPGADYSQIQIQYDGAESVSISSSGEMVVETKWGEVVEQYPVIYQMESDTRVAVIGEYRLIGENTFGFELGDYDPTLPLVIDPVLVYSTYLGGGGSEQCSAIAVDASGAAYITGATTSIDFPTVNPYQTDQYDWDVFVTKLSSSGNSPVYSTYLGGSDDDKGRGIAVDAVGNVYVVGYTGPVDTIPPVPPVGDFPMLNPYQGTHLGGAEAFVTKLSTSGNSLVYSTYLGGSGDDGAYSIAVDASGAAYVTGGTSSIDFPTQNPYQEDQNSSDAFVTKLSSAGNSLIYSTYLGGNLGEIGLSIAVDASGAAYVTGNTSSIDFPTQNSYQEDQNDSDAFVTKLASSGEYPIYSTYLGGTSDDYGYSIAVDASGAAYVTGGTSSIDFPTQNPYQEDQNSSDAFVTKLANSGEYLIYSTYLGGNSTDHGSSIAVDASGAAYVTGNTSSIDFPTQNPYQEDQGWLDGFVSKFTTNTNPDCPDLAVLPFFQTDPAWRYDTYDHIGGSWSANCPTIGCWGCAMTTLAMIIQFNGVTHGADGQPVNPGNLNAWLTNNGGYDSQGNTRWHSVRSYTNGAVEYVGGTSGMSEDLLMSDLQSGKPVPLFLRDHGHFVLATGKSNCTEYDINDPLSASNTGLSAYGNQWSSLRRFAPTTGLRTDRSYGALMIVAHGEVEMILTNAAGLQCGYNIDGDSVVSQIIGTSYYKDFIMPDSSVDDSVPTVAATCLYLYEPVLPLVQLTITGIDSTPFDLDFSLFDTDGSGPMLSSDTGIIGSSGEVSIWLDLQDTASSIPIMIPVLGDVNATGAIDVSDLTLLVDYLFAGGTDPIPSILAADVNCSGSVDIADLTYLVDYLFAGGPDPNCL